LRGNVRNTGISAVESARWGTHLCQFYNFKQDLFDVLVPYFKSGLESNELCIWVTPEKLGEEEAEAEMRKAVPDFSNYLRKGQIEFIRVSDWYLKDGVFNRQRVLKNWLDKVSQARDRGYDGIRVTGDTSWLKDSDWQEFIDYEKQINDVIRKYPMLALCTYHLAERRISEITEVMRSHHYSLLKYKEEWTVAQEAYCQVDLLSNVLNSNLSPLHSRFLKAGLEGLSEQETLELLFSLVSSPRQARQQAMQCLKYFRNLRELLAASPEEFLEAGLDISCVFCVKLLREFPAMILKERMISRPVAGSSMEVFDYLYYSMRDLKKEVFKVIYINRRNEIMDIADLFEGTGDSIHIHPHEIVESAIKRDVGGLLFVHNHPSGNPVPSKSDKQLTRDLVFVGNILQIKILDHIIIAADSYFSFADEGLIQKYEDSFMDIKIKNSRLSQPPHPHYGIAASRVQDKHRWGL